MEILPAIDLRHGKCIRLLQGQFDKQTVYHDDPLSVAEKYLAQGAKWLHVVDLDSAKGEANQDSIIQRLIRDSKLSIQIGGGIRSYERVKKLLNLGAARVVIGSLAVTQPGLVSQWLDEFGNDKIVLALDIVFNAKQQACVATHGWLKTSAQQLSEIVYRYQTSGLRHVLCTDISRDGTLTGPNLELYVSLQKQFPDIAWQASGGVSHLADLTALRQSGL